MKRSADMTVVAVLLILAGGLGTLATVVSSMTGPKMFGAQLEQAERQLNRAPVGTGEGQLRPEQVEQLRGSLRKIRQEILPLLTSPTMQLLGLLGGVLNAAACVAGIGILLLQGWARRLIVWQAGLSIPFMLWSSMATMAFQHRLSEELLGLMGNPAAQAQVQQFARIGQWIGIAIVIAWNGFILWFFNRASVKAQFEQGQSAVSSKQ